MQHTSTWGPPNLKIAYNCAICSRDIIIGTGKSFHCLVYKPIRSPNILMKQALLMLGLRIPDKIQGYAVARESMSWCCKSCYGRLKTTIRSILNLRHQASLAGILAVESLMGLENEPVAQQQPQSEDHGVKDEVVSGLPQFVNVRHKEDVGTAAKRILVVEPLKGLEIESVAHQQPQSEDHGVKDEVVSGLPQIVNVIPKENVGTSAKRILVVDRLKGLEIEPVAQQQPQSEDHGVKDEVVSGLPQFVNVIPKENVGTSAKRILVVDRLKGLEIEPVAQQQPQSEDHGVQDEVVSGLPQFVNVIPKEDVGTSAKRILVVDRLKGLENEPIAQQQPQSEHHEVKDEVVSGLPQLVNVIHKKDVGTSTKRFRSFHQIMPTNKLKIQLPTTSKQGLKRRAKATTDPNWPNSNSRTNKSRRICTTSVMGESPLTITIKNNTFKKDVFASLQNGLYKRAFKLLLSKSKKAQAAFQSIIVDKIEEELKSPSLSLLQTPVTLEFIQQFSWAKIETIIAQHMPMTRLFLGSFFGEDGKHERKYQVECGAALGMLLYFNNSSWKSIPSLLGIMWYRGGCSRLILETLHKLGMCQANGSIRRSIDELDKQTTAKIDAWRSTPVPVSQNTSLREHGIELNSDSGDMVKLEAQETKPKEVLIPRIERMSTRSYRAPTANENVSIVTNHMEVDETLPYGTSSSGIHQYSLGYDNGGFEKVKLKPGKRRNNDMYMWTPIMAFHHRPVSRCPNKISYQTCKDMKLEPFLPTKRDFESREERMEIIIKRILIAHMARYNNCKTSSHIPHANSTHMKKKTEIITLGVQNTNPGTPKETTEVMNHLETYLPEPKRPIPVHGDGASVLSMLLVQKSRATSLPEERYSNIVPVMGEFHRRMIHLQDVQDILNVGTKNDRGTLANQKAVFNMKNLQEKVEQCFDEFQDLLHMSTKGLVVLRAIHVLKLDNMNDLSPHSSDKNKQKELDEVSRDVLRYFNHRPAYNSIVGCKDVLADHRSKELCLCKGTVDQESMIECGNTDCGNGRWFHLACVGDTSSVQGNWFCCEECAASESVNICTCRKKKSSDLLTCAAGESCDRGGLFHEECVAQVDKNYEGQWWCSWQCRKKTDNTAEYDSKEAYMRALAFMGLDDLQRKDAVSEGDAEAMEGDVRMSMMAYHKFGHATYLQISHHLLSGLAGFWSQAVSDEVRANRCVNIHGGEGQNIAVDQAIEMLNTDFQRKVNSLTDVTPATVRRAQIVSGAIGHELTRLFPRYETTSTSTVTKEHKVVCDYVATYKEDALVYNIPGRKMTGAKDFDYNIEFEDCDDSEEFYQKITEHSEDLDFTT